MGKRMDFERAGRLTKWRELRKRKREEDHESVEASEEARKTAFLQTLGYKTLAEETAERRREDKRQRIKEEKAREPMPQPLAIIILVAFIVVALVFVLRGCAGNPIGG